MKQKKKENEDALTQAKQLAVKEEWPNPNRFSSAHLAIEQFQKELSLGNQDSKTAAELREKLSEAEE